MMRKRLDTAFRHADATLTPEVISKMSLEQVQQTLRQTSGVSLDPLDKGSRPQKLPPETLALLWARLDECVRKPKT
jgi:hypothetical protein